MQEMYSASFACGLAGTRKRSPSRKVLLCIDPSLLCLALCILRSAMSLFHDLFAQPAMLSYRLLALSPSEQVLEVSDVLVLDITLVDLQDRPYGSSFQQ